MHATSRPNILFALADDASHFGIFGHRFVKTPAIDYVGQHGAVFQNAFTSNPKCAPSRASILTGRYPWQLESACNHFCYFPSGFALLPDLLEQAGYYAGYTGKGWAPGDYTQAGLTRNPAGNAFNSKTLIPPDESLISRCDYAANFQDFLSKRPDGSPFYFWYGCMEPHRHYQYGEGLRAGKSLQEIDVIPDYWPDCVETRTDLMDYAYEIEWFDSHLGRMLEHLRHIGELENTLVIVTSDNGCPFPRVKGQMYEQDFHLPMVGMWLGAQQLGNRQVLDTINFIDIAPTFLEAANAPIHPQMSGKSFLDIIQNPGTGQLSPERTQTVFGREKHDQGREGDLGYPVRCIRKEPYLYIRNLAPERWPAGNPETGYTNCDSSPVKNKILELHKQGDSYYYNLAFGKRPEEELYNIVDDPQCLKNLAESPEFKPQCIAMWQELKQILTQTGDPHLLVDPDYFEKMPLLSDGASYSWKAYMEGRWTPQPF